MAAFSAEVARMDRLIFARLGGGEAVTYTPRAGPYAGVVTDLAGKAVFTAQRQVGEVGEAGVETTAPVLFVRLSDLPGFGDELRDIDEDSPVVAVDGTEYVVRGATRRDEQGGVELMLREIG